MARCCSLLVGVLLCCAERLVDGAGAPQPAVQVRRAGDGGAAARPSTVCGDGLPLPVPAELGLAPFRVLVAYTSGSRPEKTQT